MVIYLIMTMKPGTNYIDKNPCVLFQLDCCGFDGPKEFAYNNEPIDDSCYDDVTGANSGIVARREDQSVAKKMKQVRGISQHPDIAKI